MLQYTSLVSCTKGTEKCNIYSRLCINCNLSVVACSAKVMSANKKLWPSHYPGAERCSYKPFGVKTTYVACEHRLVSLKLIPLRTVFNRVWGIVRYDKFHLLVMVYIIFFIIIVEIKEESQMDFKHTIGH